MTAEIISVDRSIVTLRVSAKLTEAELAAVQKDTADVIGRLGRDEGCDAVVLGWGAMDEKHAHRIPEKFRSSFLRARPIEVRPIDPIDEFAPDKRPPFQNVWFRAVDTLPDERALHQCVLAYASDLTLLDTSALPHAISWWSEKLQTASLDHAMWFHRQFRADEFSRG